MSKAKNASPSIEEFMSKWGAFLDASHEFQKAFENVDLTELGKRNLGSLQELAQETEVISIELKGLSEKAEEALEKLDEEE